MSSDTIMKDLINWARANTSEIVVPNYYIGNYEADLLKISRAGQLTEYEVKVSRADFKKDFEKGYKSYRTQVFTSKHDIIRLGKRCNRFYFVVPDGLITPQEVPDGFGLIYATEYEYTYMIGSKQIKKPAIKFAIVKISKLFAGKHCNEAMYRHIACNLSMKLHTAKVRAYAAESNYRQLRHSLKTA